MFESLPGFRDFYPDRCAVRNFLFDSWKTAARSFGFSEYDVPILEPLDLFREKSGDEIVGQLFSFTDKGGREVVLRPELTPSLTRLAGTRAASLKKPVKWFCIGENFRYEKPQRGRLRSHYQLNADILGEAGPGADAELIALCVRALSVFGLGPRDFRVRLSDRGLWSHFLEGRGLSGARMVEVLSIIDKRERENEAVTLAKLRPLLGDATEQFIDHLSAISSLRSLDEMRAFFSGSAARGESREALERRLEEWSALLGSLESMGLGDYLQIDLGVVRGIAYYTGFVFEVFEPTGCSRALAGGGRYNDLAERLGYAAMPAVGFGMGDVVLTDLLENRKLVPPLENALDLYLIIGGVEERCLALADADRLRNLGFCVEYPLREVGFAWPANRAPGWP